LPERAEATSALARAFRIRIHPGERRCREGALIAPSTIRADVRAALAQALAPAKLAPPTMSMHWPATCPKSRVWMLEFFAAAC